jgi:hypothetical protein
MSVRGETVCDVVRLPNPWLVPVVTVAIAGELVGLTRATAYRAAAVGDLPTITMNGRLLVPVADLYARLGLPIPPRPAAPQVYSG